MKVFTSSRSICSDILYRADEIHIHDEWTRMKLDDGKYKSSDIYSSPTGPDLQEEYQEYLKKRWAEIHRKQDSK